MKERVFQAVEEAGDALTTSEVAEKIGKSWHTANRCLEELIEEGCITRRAFAGYHMNTVAEVYYGVNTRRASRNAAWYRTH
jgi:predicted transcriptional regulator